MEVTALVAVALVLCVALPGSIQAKEKSTFCIGKDGKNYSVGDSYVDNEGEACIRYKCAKRKKQFVMKKENCDCNGGNHGISCCPNYVRGDMVGGREIKITFSPNTENGCQNSCKVQHPTSIGVTQHQDGTSSCYCEFGSPIVGGSANVYKTCLFSIATPGILKTIKRITSETTATKPTRTTTTSTTTTINTKSGILKTIKRITSETTATKPTRTTTTSTTTTINTKSVLVMGPEPWTTLNLEDFSPVSSNSTIPDPGLTFTIDPTSSVSKVINGKMYLCDPYGCKSFDGYKWKLEQGMSLLDNRKHPTDLIIPGPQPTWIVHGGIQPRVMEWTPQSGKWKYKLNYTSPLPVRLNCIVMIEGKILQIGGTGSKRIDGTTFYKKVFLDDVEKASLKQTRIYHHCTIFENRVWVAGGYAGSFGVHSETVEIYNYKTDTWTYGPNLPFGAKQHDFTPKLKVINKDLYYIGTDCGAIFKLVNNVWKKVANIPRGAKYIAEIMEIGISTITTTTTTATTTTTELFTATTTSTGGFNMSATCDDVMWLFADGDLLVGNSSDWRVTSEVHIPACTKVIEIHCLDSWIHGGILASSDNGLITDGAWNCSSDNRTTWNPAYLLGRNGRTAPDISPEAIWIWTDMSHWMQTDHRRHTKAICKIELETSQCPEPTFCPPLGELTPTTISTPAPTTTSTTSKPKPGFNLTATCDNEMKLFVDGNLLATSSNWRDTSKVNIPADTEAIEIHCMDTGTVGGILASSDNGLLTDGAWNCSSDNGTTWNPAYEVGPNSGAVPDISPEAEWIWTGCIGDWTSKYTGKKYQKNIICKIDLKPVIDGGWSEWSPFSPCSATCGDATKTRTRTCSNPPPKNGGEPCLGMEEEVVSCGVDPCGGKSCPYTDKYMDCSKWKNHCESGQWKQCVKENCPKTCKCTDTCVSFCSSIEGCSLVRNTLMTTLTKLGKEFFISFEYKATAYSGIQSVIHFTEDGNCCNVGKRIPGVWARGDGRLQLSFSINGSGDYYVNTEKYPVGQWHQAEFSQRLENGKYIYRVNINGKNVVEVENNDPRVFSNVKVYAADPWYWSLEGSIRNLFINNEAPNKCAVDMCTGDFYENGRPPAGTKCVEKDNKMCYMESGRWGKSWCYTEVGGWGAECVKCSDTINATTTTRTSTIVVTGGSNRGGKLATSEVIGPEGVCSGGIPPLPVALELHASVFFNNQLMVCGGKTNTYQKKCYFLKDAASKSWVEGPSLNTPRAWFTLTKVGVEVFAVGGEGSSGDLDTIEKLSGNPAQWKILDKKMSTIRELHCTVYWEKNNSLVVIGGNYLVNIAQSFNLKTGVWSDLAQLPVLRELACSVYEDSIVVTGGWEHASKQDNLKIYVYKEGNWETIGEMDGPRRYHTMDVLDGKLLVIGGTGRDGIEQIRSNGTLETLNFSLSGIRQKHSAAKVPAVKFPCFH